MKRYLMVVTVAFLATIFPSCSKEKIEQKVEDIVVQVMTNGVWLVTHYQEGNDTLTAQFANWESQFFENKTCTAKNTATNAVINGTWDGSYSSQTMTGNFGNSAPVNKMNGIWKIIRSTYTVGQFTKFENGKEYKLNIMKK